MAVMVRWQTLGLRDKKSTAVHICGCIQAREYIIFATNLRVTILRYLLRRLTSLP
jgi:hypothetical protein